MLYCRFSSSYKNNILSSLHNINTTNHINKLTKETNS